jgi:lipoprotein signal peptidase
MRAAAWARMLITAISVLLLDQGSKQLVINSLERGEKRNVFIGLDLTNVRNDGIAFGIGSGGTVIAVITAAALTLLIVWFAAHSTTPRMWLPVGALLGGALGNLADRARDGAVVDFIDFVAWPAFNLADTAIVLGLLGLLYVAESDTQRRKAARAA